MQYLLKCTMNSYSEMCFILALSIILNRTNGSYTRT
jgi:hypothetical protein